MKTSSNIIAFCILFFYTHEVHAELFPYDSKNTVIGSVAIYKVKPGESLIEIARKFDLGYNEISDANPGLDPFVPGTGAEVTVPTSWIVPDAGPSEEIVINLGELRLYYFSKVGTRRFVQPFPIGIGSEGNDTPLGGFKIIEKIVRPAWHVPESIKKEKPWLPDVVPPGPDNPLGSHAMRLSLPTILIHGTNKPWALGRRATHGCIRLYPEDIPRLFKSASKNTKVTIIMQPVKVGVRNGRVYVEVHQADTGEEIDYFAEAELMLRQKGLVGLVSTEKLHYAVEERLGIPVDITE